MRCQGVHSEGTNLGGGIVTRTDVKYLADLTLDIKDMRTSYGNPAVVMDIYNNGRNSQQPSGLKFKLQDLGAEMSKNGITGATPLYLFQMYGLAEQSFNIETLADFYLYSNSNVRVAINSNQDHAPTASLVLDMWMYASHLLYAGVEMCQKMVEADNPAQFDLGGAGLDEFIALWIGTGESHAGSQGYGLYGLAEQAADLFENILDVSANKAIKNLYHEGSQYLSVGGACTKEVADSPKLLWSVANRIASQMYIPLIQMLIHSIQQKDADMTVLFANAIVPQAAQCRTSTYARLREHLLVGAPKFDKSDIILNDLQEIYSCFGLSCSDIGTYSGDDQGDDDDDSDSDDEDCLAGDAALAGYRPTSGVLSIAQIDLDILHLKILTSIGNFNYARFWYMYGRNSPVQRDSSYDLYTFYSIADHAVASSRKNAEETYSSFIEYFNDANYAGKIIMEALEGRGKWGSKSTEQRSAIITETSAFLVLYLHMIAQIDSAVNHCQGNLANDGDYDLTHPWDEVAALLVGSLEGTEQGGSVDGRDGQLIWSLNTRRGFQFQTLNSDGYSKINSDLIDALWAGRGEIDALDCKRFASTCENIKKLTLIPLLQSIIHYAMRNNDLDGASSKEELAFGETFALSVLPIINAVDVNSANVIAENMVYNDLKKPVSDGPQAVADAVGGAAVALGLKCSQLGSTVQADPCRLIKEESSGATSTGTLVIATMTGIATLCYSMALL